MDAMTFDGADYVHERDAPRLTGQLEAIYTVMVDGKWRRLADIEALTGAPSPSISAQLRHLRKPRFGGHIVNRRYVGGGLYEYQLETK